MANPVFNSQQFNEQMRSGDGRRGGGADQVPGWYQNSGSQNAGAYTDGQQSVAAAQQSQSAEQLEQMYQRPAAGPADTGRMTYNDVLARTLMVFGLVLAGALVGWSVPALMLPGAIVGLILGLVNAFKREPSPALILLYGGAMGLFLGGISATFQQLYPGIVVQAVLGTFSVFAVTLALYASGKVRATAKSVRIFMIAMIGYALFSVINLFLMLFGVTDSMFGLREGWLGLAIGAIAVFLAAFSLVIDFTAIEQGVRAGAPQKYAWTAAFGLAVTLIWLYTEILRILAILREMNN